MISSKTINFALMLMYLVLFVVYTFITFTVIGSAIPMWVSVVDVIFGTFSLGSFVGWGFVCYRSCRD